MAKRISYTDILNYVSSRGMVSVHRARIVLSTLSKVLQDAVKTGDNLNVEGVFKIEYTSTDNHIHKNDVYGYSEQVKEVVERTKIGEQDVRNVINRYYARIRELVGLGYQVNVKGVGYVIPKEVDGGVYCDVRVSPVLEKPVEADYLVMGEDGTLYVKTLAKEDLRFTITISDQIKIPSKLIRGTELVMEVVDI